MTLSTTPSLDGKKTFKYLGLVSGNAILVANIFRDCFASIRDIVGAGRRPMKLSCARPGTLLLAKCASRQGIWAPMRSAASISIMKRSASAAGC